MQRCLPRGRRGDGVVFASLFFSFLSLLFFSLSSETGLADVWWDAVLPGFRDVGCFSASEPARILSPPTLRYHLRSTGSPRLDAKPLPADLGRRVPSAPAGHRDREAVWFVQRVGVKEVT